MRKLLAALVSSALLAPAASAQTLPQGRGRVSFGIYYFRQALPTVDVPHLLDTSTTETILKELKKRVVEGLDINGRDLSLMMPGLSFSGNVEVLLSLPQIDYGITDRLTVSLIWPYFNLARTNVRFHGEHSGVAYNIAYDPRKPVATENLPVTVDRGKMVTGTEGLQLLLTNFFGYHRVESYRGYGTGDPLLAFSYGFGGHPRSLRVSLFGQFPFGRIADPDNPFAFVYGEGHFKLGSRFWLEDSEGHPWTIGFGLGHVFHFRDHPTLRIYKFAAIPLSTVGAKEQVTRTQGQQLGGQVAISRQFLEGLLRPAIVFGVEHVFSDAIRGGRDPSDYAAVIENSGRNIYSGELTLTLSTVERFLQRRFAIPATFTLGLRSQVVDKGVLNGIGQLQLSLTSSTFF